MFTVVCLLLLFVTISGIDNLGDGAGGGKYGDGDGERGLGDGESSDSKGRSKHSNVDRKGRRQTDGSLDVSTAILLF